MNKRRGLKKTEGKERAEGKTGMQDRCVGKLAGNALTPVSKAES